jgi:hypothetical protein
MGLSGIRFYQPGATIAEHVDMATSNVISALINIDQQVRRSHSLMSPGSQRYARLVYRALPLVLLVQQCRRRLSPRLLTGLPNLRYRL